MATITRPLTTGERAIELNQLSRKQRSLWKDAMYRLVRNKAAMAGVVIIVLAALMAIFAQWIAPYDPIQQHPGKGVFEPIWGDPRYRDPAFILGTDELGRDLLSRLIWSARISMVVGFVPVALIFLFGVSVGMIAGYAGGWVDQLLMRITDITYAFPDLLFLLIIMATLRNTPAGDLMGGLVLLFVGIAIVNRGGMARRLRGQVMSLKNAEFVQAARLAGTRPAALLFRHLLPNILSSVIVYGTLTVPSVILQEAFLSFLGLGVQPPRASWGTLISDGANVMGLFPWMVFFPSVILAAALFSLNFLGDGLRDAFDPRLSID